jgi:putative oxidoreductase
MAATLQSGSEAAIAGVLWADRRMFQRNQPLEYPPALFCYPMRYAATRTTIPRNKVGMGLMVTDTSNAIVRATPAPVADFAILVGRVMIGWIFVQSGWPKLLHYQATVANLTHRGIPEFLAYLGPPVEFFGGLAVLLGFATPYAALLMVVFTIIATATSHRFWEFTDPAQHRAQSSNFWKNVSMMGGMLVLFASGGGRFSIDRLLFRRD